MTDIAVDDNAEQEAADELDPVLFIARMKDDPIQIGVNYDCSPAEALQYLTRAAKIVRTQLNAARKQRSGLIVPDHLRR